MTVHSVVFFFYKCMKKSYLYNSKKKNKINLKNKLQNKKKTIELMCCNFCHKSSSSYSTNNLKFHLQYFHPS